MPCKSTDIEMIRSYRIILKTSHWQINQGHFDSTSSELIFTGVQVRVQQKDPFETCTEPDRGQFTSGPPMLPLEERD